jgi:hypothetical protein
MRKNKAEIYVSRFVVMLLATGFATISGCSSAPPTYEDAMNSSTGVKANSSIIAAPLDKTWSHTLLVLPRREFIIRNIDDVHHVITATREITDKNDEETSHKITASITILPLERDKTEVVVAANRETEVHHKEHTWWHLLWIIPLFPTGTEYTTVVTERDTIHSPHFYDEFFKSLNASIKSGDLTTYKTEKAKAEAGAVPAPSSGVPEKAKM